MTVLWLNVLAVIAATIAAMLCGALWYSPYFLGNQWMQCVGRTPEALSKTKLPMAGAVIANLMIAIGIALLFALTGVDSFSLAAMISLVLGFFLIFPAFLSDTLFCDTSIRLLFIQTGYRIFTILIMAIVIEYVA